MSISHGSHWNFSKRRHGGGLLGKSEGGLRVGSPSSFTFKGDRGFWKHEDACFWVLDMNPEYLEKNDKGHWKHTDDYRNAVMNFLGRTVAMSTCDRRRRDYVTLGGDWR